ncbi:MAG: hypothetical protein GXO27_06105 [Chlorobi bacterium]|nr:hypothetical protein [Chlorobiota bacterium]
MSKRVWLHMILAWTAALTLYGQTAEGERAAAEAVLVKSGKLKIHSTMAVENYLYFMRGILPLETGDALDESLALAEEYHTDIELFNRRRGRKEFLDISAYWRNIRIKLVHSYRDGLATDLAGKLQNMHALQSRMEHELINRYKLKHTKERLLLWKALFYTHQLSMLYVAHRMEPTPALEKMRKGTILTYNNLIGKIANTKFHSSVDRKMIAYVLAHMDRLLNLVEDPVSDPEEVYQTVMLIHRPLYKWLYR